MMIREIHNALSAGAHRKNSSNCLLCVYKLLTSFLITNK
jgi:hypothetical protein